MLFWNQDFLIEWRNISIALDLFKDNGMLVCQLVGTLVEKELMLCIMINQVLVDKERYKKFAGRWMYLAYIRPNFSNVLSIVH